VPHPRLVEDLMPADLDALARRHLEAAEAQLSAEVRQNEQLTHEAASQGVAAAFLRALLDVANDRAGGDES